MTTKPDYAAIDWVLENVKGARPIKEIDEGDGPDDVAFVRHSRGWCWTADTRTFEPSAMRIDDPDALAILRDWWMVHLESHSVFQWPILKDGDWAFSVSTGTLGSHPDRTTALALLVRRVHEAGEGKA